MKKIRVVQIRDSCGLYGAERVILAIGKYLNKDKYNLTLVALRSDNNDIKEFLHAARLVGLKTIMLDVVGRLDINAIIRLKNIFKNLNIDIIHSHDFKSNFYTILSTMRLPVCRVVTSHGSTRDSALKKIYLFLDERIFYRFFDLIIAVSQNMRNFLIGKKVCRKKLKVIQNGIDESSIDAYEGIEKAEKIIEKKHDTILFGVIGRFFPDKGHRFFIEAFADISKKYKNAHAIFVGDGPLKKELKDLIKMQKLENNINLIGFRNDMHTVYEKIDCVVIPSLREGLPYVLLESMIKRVPVIATSVGDIPRLVKHRKTGYLVAPGDIAALKKYMTSIIENPEISFILAANAYNVVIKKFSADKMVKEIEKEYEKLKH